MDGGIDPGRRGAVGSGEGTGFGDGVITALGMMLLTSEGQPEHAQTEKDGSKKIFLSSPVDGQKATLVPSINLNQSASRGGLPTK